MKAFPWFFLSILLILGPVWSLDTNRAYADKIRQPVRAGQFYPADPAELSRMIDRLTREAQKTRVRIPHDKGLKALIMPHAGFIYSGWTAAHAAQVLTKNQFSKVILLGPDHFIGIKNGAICDAEAYQTPLGRIALHRETKKLLRHSELFKPLPVSIDQEHSLEVVLPFLQTYMGSFQLMPIIVGRTNVGPFAGALNGYIKDDTLLVVSSDLSHYLSYSEAVAVDRDTVNEILNLDSAKLVSKDNRACGLMPALILMEIARRNHWQPVFLHYSNSGDTAGNRSRVVGYTAIAFFGDQSMENKHDSSAQLTEEQGQVLVKLARHTIMEKLGHKVSTSGADADTSSSTHKEFQAHCGTFVTLKIKRQLRGCIGNLSSTETIWDGVKRNAINAAFHDPRFSPLSTREFDQTEIEVSVLTEPRLLEYRNGEDLINKLRVNIDGVIIRKGHASATFLPQVWEQLPQPEEFLSHLCMKAGLSSNAWKDPELEVLTYQVQYFEEK
jgi:AmmeMemoRadiSam system protein B/AmmeMemoRadiSam system protein A